MRQNHPGFHRRRQLQLPQAKTTPDMVFGFNLSGPLIGEERIKKALVQEGTRGNGTRTLTESVASQLVQAISESRKADVHQIATYRGVRYRFPDSLPGETVFFENGLPVSSTGVVVPCDSFGFDVLPSNTSASAGPVHNPRHTAPSQSNAVHSDSSNKCDDLAPDFSNSHPVQVLAPQTDRTLRTGDGDAGRARAMPCQDTALLSAFDDGNADKRI